MRLTNLKPASDFDVRDWLLKSIRELTPYQKEWIKNDEIIRFSPYEFYEQRKQEKVSVLWRLTILLVPIYLIIIYSFLPIKMIITGEWGYGQKFFDNFHAKWMHKLNL